MNNTGQKSSSFLELKPSSKINPSIENDKARLLYACLKEKYFTSSAEIS